MPRLPTISANRNRITGMALMALAMLMVPGLDAIAKLLMERLPPLQVTLGRFLMQTLVLLPVFLLGRRNKSLQLGHVAAGVFLGCALLTFNFALQVMPIANALAIFFVEPLILTLLAAVVLHESLGKRRLVAIGLGLCGALVILRPNISAYGSTALFPLATAFLFACYMMVTRRMSQSGDLLTLQFWTGFFAAVALLIGLGTKIYFYPDTQNHVQPNIREIGLFVLLGVLAGLGHQLIIRSLSYIEAGHAAPLQYLEIVSAVILGWVIFADFPDVLTWVGTLLIVGAGLYIARDELRRGQGAGLR